MRALVVSRSPLFGVIKNLSVYHGKLLAAIFEQPAASEESPPCGCESWAEQKQRVNNSGWREEI